MANTFEDLTTGGDLVKSRLLYLSAFVCSFIFYGFMVRLSPLNLDFPIGRMLTAFFAAVAFIMTFIRPKLHPDYFFSSVMLSYILLYLYLLHIHEWSLFHRWSYFVVAAIFCSCTLSWGSYLVTAFVSIVFPVILGLFSPLTALELVHFHSANFTVFFVIGISVRAVFKYKTEVLKLTKTMVQASKMVALGEMAGGIAHEINTPLSVIAGYAEMLKVKMKQNNAEPRTLEIIGKIESTTFKIADIILGLRHFSQEGSSEEFQPTDLREVITQALKLCSEKFAIKGVLILSQLPETPVPCMCQKNQMTHAVINLLNNAFDACHKVNKAQIQITLLQKQGFGFVHVFDNGPGVSKELDEKIMQPFFTTKEIGGGTGLGLSVATGIVQSHKGSLYLDRLQSASSFIIKLPLIKPSSIK